MEHDEPLTPAGRLFLRPETTQIIHCAIGVKNAADVDAIKAVIKDSPMLKLPRFCSLLVVDSNGREHWRRTPVDLDRHVIVHHDPVADVNDPTATSEEIVNDYMADLAVSSPLSTDKPLWELHLLLAHRCGVLRAHHALGDGISLMSLFLLSFRRADDPTRLPTIKGLGTSGSAPASGRRRRRRSCCCCCCACWCGLCKAVKMVLFTLLHVMEFCLTVLWSKDGKNAVSGGAGVELWPRKLATARFEIDDMKVVKKAVVGATINDVLFGIISSGFSKYLLLRSPPDFLKEGLKITGVAMVNLRPLPGLQEMSVLLNNNSIRFGNHFGMLLLPVYCHKRGKDPLQFVRRAKNMIDKKKLSVVALFSYKVGFMIMSLFGPKFASMLNYRILCNTTFTISNVVGPAEEITIAGNPVTYLRATSSSLPHALTMHMMSYAGRADMQILVAKDIIPDPQVLAKCLEDALLEMKDFAVGANSENHPSRIEKGLMRKKLSRLPPAVASTRRLPT